VGGGTGFALGFMPMAQVEGVAPGIVDLVATRWTGGTGAASRIVLQRGINPANGSTVAVDFAGSASFEPVTRTVTVNNAMGQQVGVGVNYVTSRGEFGMLENRTGTGFAFQFASVPAGQQVAGDLHLLSVSAVDNVQNPLQFRAAHRAFGAAADLTMTLGPALNPPTVTVAATQPYARLRAALPVQSQYASFFLAGFDQDSPGRSAQVQMSAGYSQGAGTVTLEVPDLTGAAGWQNSWGLQPGVPAAWTVMGMGFPQGTSNLTGLADGLAWDSAQRSGTIVP
jgi:hypothetical protein